jgi:hypothetical protein
VYAMIACLHNQDKQLQGPVLEFFLYQHDDSQQTISTINGYLANTRLKHDKLLIHLSEYDQHVHNMERCITRLGKPPGQLNLRARGLGGR